MASKFRRSSEFPVPVQRLLELLTDTDFIAAQEKHFGALSVEASKRDTPDGLLITIEKSEPGRSATGKKDPQRPERYTTTQQWNLAARSCQWTMVHHTYKDKVRVSGRQELKERPQGCELVEEGEIDIRVPLIGKMLEQKFTASIERKGPAYRDYILSRLAAAVES